MSNVRRMGQLICVMEALQCQDENCCARARRFLRVPTGKSTLAQSHDCQCGFTFKPGLWLALRFASDAEVRYSGRHYW
eukprot:638402-Amphidinium_carterae.3